MPKISKIKLGDTIYDITQPSSATDDKYGLVKTNAKEGIYINDNGQLYIKGSAVPSAGGGYSFGTAEPAEVGKNSVLVTEGAGVSLGTKSLAVTTGVGLSVDEAAAGSTVYTLSNTYSNRILAFMCKGGRAALNETEAAEGTVKINSITISGSSTWTPTSAANDSSNKITITLAESVNPDSSTKSIRVYPLLKGFSNAFIGTCGAQNQSFGYSVLVGQNVYNEANASAVFGNTQYNKGNSSILAGRQHINTKMNAALFGYGHDSSNGSDNVFAAGKFADIQSDTVFVIGNGSSHVNRNNLLELKSNGKLYINGTAIN